VITVLFQNGKTRDLPIAGIYDEATLAGNWLISTETLDSVVTGQQTDFFVAAKVADGVTTADAIEAINRVLEDYPQAELQTREEFTNDQAAQIDQLLVVITVLLGLS